MRNSGSTTIYLLVLSSCIWSVVAFKGQIKGFSRYNKWIAVEIKTIKNKYVFSNKICSENGRN